jgi:hypothetical protein
MKDIQNSLRYTQAWDTLLYNKENVPIEKI